MERAKTGARCAGCGESDPALDACALLRPGSTVSERSCEIYARVARTVRGYVSLRYPERADDADDAIQEVWLRLATSAARAPERGLELRRWLRAVAFHSVTDLFRKSRVVARKRCGACAHFRGPPPGGCEKMAVRDPASGEEIPNPWSGDRVRADTAPDDLDPPCREFSWRYRPRPLAEVAEAVAARWEDPASAVEPPGVEALEALARLARRGPESLRRAAVVYRHAVEGEPLEEVARSLGITSRTARRDAKKALAELREMLEARGEEP